LIAARGDVEIVNAQPAGDIEVGCDVTAISFFAEIPALDLLEGDFAQRGNAVIALLSVDGDMFVTRLADVLHRKGIVDAFDFLEAEDVRLFFPEQSFDEIYPQADGIDVPGGDLEGQRAFRFVSFVQKMLK